MRKAQEQQENNVASIVREREKRIDEAVLLGRQQSDSLVRENEADQRRYEQRIHAINVKFEAEMNAYR